MIKKFIHILLPTLVCVLPSMGHAEDVRVGRQDYSSAPERTYAQNYKDMILANCISTAYRNEPDASNDAGSSASALVEVTYVDFEEYPDTSRRLIDNFLARNYFDPMMEAEVRGVLRFDLLKCLDLYHSKELDGLVKEVVINPERSYRQDNPVGLE